MKFKTITSVPLEFIGQKDDDRIIGVYICDSIHELKNYLENIKIKLTDQQIYRHTKYANDPLMGFIAKNKNNVIYDYEHTNRARNAYELCIQIFRIGENDEKNKKPIF